MRNENSIKKGLPIPIDDQPHTHIHIYTQIQMYIAYRLLPLSPGLICAECKADRMISREMRMEKNPFTTHRQCAMLNAK